MVTSEPGKPDEERDMQGRARDVDRDSLIEEAFFQAIDLPTTRRLPFLTDLCQTGPLAGDADALRELEELLAADARGGFEVERRDAVQVTGNIGPYTLLQELGRGGMGTVYLAEQHVPVKRRVAIKLIEGVGVSPELTARFEIERQACARMQHEGIAKLLDAGTTEGGRPFYVMEYVRGAPLLEHCNEAGLGLAARLRLFVEVCRAVHHAHQKGVLHRDLKPANILVDLEGQEPSPKIIDFGVAKWVDAQAAGDYSPTISGELLGTPEYMSPEQAAGMPLDTRSDVFSLGVVLFELVTGQRPYRGRSTRLDVLRAIQTDASPRPSTRITEPRASKELRGDIDWIVTKALSKEAERRYQSCSEFAADIERYLAGEAIEARPPSRAYRFKKLLGRNRGASIGIATTVVALIVGATVAAWQAQRAGYHLAEYRRMADAKLARDLKTRADEVLWPAVAKKIPALERWLDEARGLTSRRPQHEKRVQELRERISPSESPASATILNEVGWQIDTIEQLLIDIASLEADDTRGPTIASVAHRLDRARALRSETIDAHAAAWMQARAAIADESVCPPYAGLRLSEQEGLVPLGRTPRTMLYEFWHPASGDRPSFDADGMVQMEASSGMVLVLIPGGRFVMGSVKTKSEGARNVDPYSGNVSRPEHEVELAPFFLSRFEMTQGQWERWTGENPSRLQAPTGVRGRLTNATHPVERVDWDRARQVLVQLGLELPTEAQWEYAARAGTSTVYERGDDPACVKNFENLADAASKSVIGGAWGPDPGTDDGYGLHAPVGSYAPNRWGFYDMPGNVAEWCVDAFLPYTVPVRAGDGLRTTSQKPDSRVARGGSFYWPAANARSAERHRYIDTYVAGFIGLRAARRLEIED